MKYIKNTALLLMCVCLLLNMAGYVHAAEILDTGNCDDGVTWTLYADQSLVFEGSGSITRSSFSNYDVKKAVLSDGVTAIGQGAFSWLYLMTEIQLNEGLQAIDMYAFQGCTQLPEITIPASVTSIGYQAFSQCPNLEKIIFLGSRPDINRHAFYNGDDTTHPITIYYPDDGTWQRSDMNWWNGVTTWIPYTMDANGQMVPDESRAYVVEEYIHQLIEEGNASDTITYKVYDKYREIGYHSVVYEGTGPLNGYGRKALNIHIGEGITSIGDEVFGVTDELQSLYIPSTVTSIGWGNFNGYNIAELAIPEGVEILGDSFHGNQLLTKLTLPESLKELSGFKYCPLLEHVELPSSLTQINRYAFLGCTALKSVSISASVETIDSYAFGGCENLTEITYLGAPPEIDREAFGENPEYGDDYEWNLPPLTVYYPDDGSWTEEDMVYLHRTTTYIPYTVGANGERIPDESRANVVEFVALTSGTFASGGSWRIENDILYVGGCVDITPDEDFDYRPHWANIKGLVVEEGVAYFNCGFSEHEHLASVTFPDSYYGGVVFYYCQALEEINLGNSIVTIEDYFISHCDNLKKLVIPASVGTFRRGSVYGEGLETITFLGSAPTFAQERPINRGVGEITFYYPANDPSWTDEIMQALCRSTGIWIPYTLDANGQMVPDESQAKRFVGVVAIIDWSWDNIATLYSDGTARFVYGGSVSSIHEHQFPSEWQHVTHIEIDEGYTDINMTLKVTHDQPVTISLPSTLTTIDCLNVPNLKHLDLSHVTTIAPVYYDEWGNPSNVVLQCPNLETVVLSEQLTEIPVGAFQNTKLASIDIPDSVTVIGAYAFAGTKLQSVVIPDTVTMLGGGTFQDCTELESVQLSRNLTSMGGDFKNCVKLTELELPDSLVEVGGDIVSGTSVRELIFPDGITSLASQWDCPELVRVVLPEGITVVGGFQNCPKLEEVIIPESAAYV